MSENGFSNPLRPFEIRLHDQLVVSAHYANQINSPFRRCVIGKIEIKRDLSTTFHHPA